MADAHLAKRIPGGQQGVRDRGGWGLCLSAWSQPQRPARPRQLQPRCRRRVWRRAVLDQKRSAIVPAFPPQPFGIGRRAVKPERCRWCDSATPSSAAEVRACNGWRAASPPSHRFGRPRWRRGGIAFGGPAPQNTDGAPGGEGRLLPRGSARMAPYPSHDGRQQAAKGFRVDLARRTQPTDAFQSVQAEQLEPATPQQRRRSAPPPMRTTAAVGRG